MSYVPLLLRKMAIKYFWYNNKSIGSCGLWLRCNNSSSLVSKTQIQNFFECYVWKSSSQLLLGPSMPTVVHPDYFKSDGYNPDIHC